MNNTKRFPVEALLSVVCNRLLIPRDKGGIGAMYDFLKWMTGESVWTHQLGRFMDECRPWLFRWFPELGTAAAGIGKLDGWIAKDRSGDNSQALLMWLTEMRMIDPRIGREYDVPRIPPDGHTRIDPVEELEGKIGKGRVIVVEPPEVQ